MGKKKPTTKKPHQKPETGLMYICREQYRIVGRHSLSTANRHCTDVLWACLEWAQAVFKSH